MCVCLCVCEPLLQSCTLRNLAQQPFPCTCMVINSSLKLFSFAVVNKKRIGNFRKWRWKEHEPNLEDHLKATGTLNEWESSNTYKSYDKRGNIISPGGSASYASKIYNQLICISTYIYNKFYHSYNSNINHLDFLTSLIPSLFGCIQLLMALIPLKG